MVNHLFLKHLLSDTESLANYLEGNVVPFNELTQNIFLLQRNQNQKIPDHYYRSSFNKEFEGLNSLQSVLLKLEPLSKSLLTLKIKTIIVKNEKFENWQELLTFIPPLLLQTAFLSDSFDKSYHNFDSIKKYFTEYILLNFLYTTLPSPDDIKFKNHIKPNAGFNDLHIHLNGSTETDKSWQDFLRDPDLIYKDLQKGILKNSVVIEQLKQEFPHLNSFKLFQLLQIARKLREVIFEFIFPSQPGKLEGKTLEDILNEVIIDPLNKNWNSSYLHPFKLLIDKNATDHHFDTAIESLMYLLVFHKLKRESSPALSSIFHFYLLILGLFNRLLVQQLHQYGFEQFQKLTLNNLREQSESRYEPRFLQMHGNSFKNLSSLEGRFSPRDTLTENEFFISAIQSGWDSFINKINERKLSSKNPNLYLIAHFIKKREIQNNERIQFKDLRKDIYKRAKSLIYLKRGKCIYRNLVGIDAASNELHTPPEVFAPIFRMLRREGFSHFTYHSGEDFYHLLSGLRAIYEAVTFNELSTGDRIGHAIAAGIKPSIWINNLGKSFFMKSGEYLDDLVFIRYLISHLRLRKLYSKIKLIESRIFKLASRIYGSNFDIKEYTSSWMLRKYCPFHLLEDSYEYASNSPVFDYIEWTECKNSQNSIRSLEYYALYHSKQIQENYCNYIEVETEEIFDSSQLELLQQAILTILANKGLAIEVLPTSNIRISHYRKYADHHIWTWKRWAEEKIAVPEIVLGTDDTGIFATNILNEYYHLYYTLKRLSEEDALNYTLQLKQNGEKYLFEN